MSLPLRSLGGRGEGRGEVRVIPTKHQKPFDPLQICLLGAQGIMMKAHDLPHLLPQPGLGIGDQLLLGCGFSKIRVGMATELNSCGRKGKIKINLTPWKKSCRAVRLNNNVRRFAIWPQAYPIKLRSRSVSILLPPSLAVFDLLQPLSQATFPTTTLSPPIRHSIQCQCRSRPRIARHGSSVICDVLLMSDSMGKSKL